MRRSLAEGYDEFYHVTSLEGVTNLTLILFYIMLDLNIFLKFPKEEVFD